MRYILALLTMLSVACNGQGSQRTATRTQPVENASAQSSHEDQSDDPSARYALLLARPVPEIGTKSTLAEDDYRAMLTPEEYHILREQGTERAFTGEYNATKRHGVFHCKACNAPLFHSDTKFDSGTGWPSFYDAIEGRVERVEDNSFGMKRVEVVCAHCGSHLGHVFEDGPEPTGLRYCIDSLSLVLEER